jgi:hypothetical protein
MKQRKKSFGMRISAFVLSFAMVCTLLAGVNVVAFAADGDSSDTIAIQKFYNDAKKGGDGEHLFTKDEDEMRWLSTLPTWNNEGEAWKAPVTSSEAVYRCYNPNSGEHLYVDEGYADYLAGSGWNKEKLAFYSDDNMGTPVYRLWNGTDGVGSHHFTTDAGEVEWLVGQGWIAEDVAFYGVKEEYSNVIQLVDRSGIQADGTALKNDTLAVVFGSDLGIPAKVVWYCNGAVVSVYDTELTEASFMKQAYLTGSWSVQVENTAGKVFKTNAITVVDEGVALMDDVNIADYTDAFSNKKDVAGGQNIVYQTYAQQDTKAVISADLNKLYAGNFELYKASDVASGDFKKANPVATWSVGNFVAGSGSQIEVPSQFTDKTAIEKAYDAAGGTKGAWIRNNDGSYSFKLVTKDNDAVTRGEKYVLAFWQTGHDDAPVSVADPFEAPYLPAPKAVSISDCTTASGAITASMTFWADEEMTEELEYLGDKANATSAAALGIDVNMYASKTNNLNKDADMNFRAGTYIEAGKSETYMAAGNINEFVGVWGTAKTTQNIYGKSSTTLKTTLAPLPAESAQSMGIEYSVSDPYDLKVSFTGLKTDGTVLVARTTTNGQIEVQAANAKLLSDPTSAVGMAQVTKGTKSVDVENVVDDIYNTTRTQGDFYTAVFVPSDPTTFAVESTYVQGNTKAMANVTPTMAMIDLDEDEEFEAATNTAITAKSSGTILVAIDQFGEEIGPKTNVPASSASAILVSEAVSQDLDVSFETDANGYLIVNSNKKPVDLFAKKVTQVGDAYTLKVSPLQTLVMTCTDIEYTTVAGNQVPAHVYWTFSVK